MSLEEPLLNFDFFLTVLLTPGARVGLVLITKLHLWLCWLEGEHRGLVSDSQQVKVQSFPSCITHTIRCTEDVLHLPLEHLALVTETGCWMRCPSASVLAVLLSPWWASVL